ncbi:MAG TPA: RDD family protein [Tahibacter sp.]|nr:RDD family protein [Tahibacter sp.]
MQEHNPYASPTAAVAETVGQSAAPGELAGRGVRLGAALIDAVLLLAILTPLQWFSGFLPDLIDARQHGERLPWSTMVLWATIGITLFTALQSWPLHRNGQTWGKRLLSIRIVDLDGDRPPLWRLLVLRYLPMHIVGQVPIVGPLIGLINPMFIFRADQRCLHDLIAGTRVVVAR